MLEAHSTAAAERIVQQKIQGPKIRKFEPLDRTEANAFEMLLDCRARYFLLDERIKALFTSNEADVGGIAFISGTGVADIEQLNFHAALNNSLLAFISRLDAISSVRTTPITASGTRNGSTLSVRCRDCTKKIVEMAS